MAIDPSDVEPATPTDAETAAEDDLPPESPKSEPVDVGEIEDPAAETPAGTEPQP